MEQTRGEDEPDRVSQRVGRIRQFRAVRVAVENGEDSDKHPGDPQRRPGGEGYRQPKEHTRERNACLRTRQRHAQNAQRAAEGHHHRKDHRQQPHGRSAEIRAPQTHGHHGDDVVQASERMQEATDESADPAFLRVGTGHGGHQEQQRKDGHLPSADREKSGFRFHGRKFGWHGRRLKR